MTPIAVRQATLSDLDALAPLFDGYRQFYGRDSDVAAARAFLLERFNHGESVVFLAYQGQTPVGFTQLYPSFSSVSMARVFVLNDLFVHASARCMGVGARLMAAATEYARTVGAIRLTLFTATSNATAKSLYEAAGWKRDESFYVYNLAVSG